MLFTDAEESPQKYEEETRDLLQEIMAGQKTMEALSPEERRLLDAAVLLFMTAPKKKREPEKLASAVIEDQPEDQEEGEETEHFEKDAELLLPPFWWT